MILREILFGRLQKDLEVRNQDQEYVGLMDKIDEEQAYFMKTLPKDERLRFDRLISLIQARDSIELEGAEELYFKLGMLAMMEVNELKERLIREPY